MAKGQKSSASSATRKKHARKVAVSTGIDLLPLPKEKKAKDKEKGGKGKGKGKNDSPRVKAYIPPTKPSPARPDPLDALGIGKRLPPELLVVLRKLAKKDSVTKRKALEELAGEWIGSVGTGRDEDGTKEAALGLAVPVWIHHLPSLLLHSSRRVRLQAASTHAALLRIRALREPILAALAESPSALGAWAMAAHDADRPVAREAGRPWDEWVVLDAPSVGGNGEDAVPGDGKFRLDIHTLEDLLSFVRRALLSPVRIYAELNPVGPAGPSSPAPSHHGSPVPTRTHTPTPARGAKGKRQPQPMAPALSGTATPSAEGEGRRADEDEEGEEDRRARLRVGALGVVRWVVEHSAGESLPATLSGLFASTTTWTALFHGADASFAQAPRVPDADADVESTTALGAGQPTVRRAAWGVLGALLKMRVAYVEQLVPVLSSAVLRSTWVEPDAGVRSVMWEPLLLFLRQHPNAWEIDARAAQSGGLPLLGAGEALGEEDDDGSSDESSDDEASEEEDAHDEGQASAEPHIENAKQDDAPARQEAYAEFLQFLALGCHGSPSQGYPIVVLVLATIPPSILGSSASRDEFLTSFWAALDGRALSALDRSASAEVFLSALLECVVFLAGRARRAGPPASTGDADPGIGETVREQVARVLAEAAGRLLRAAPDVVGRLLARFVERCEGIDEGLFSSAWSPIAAFAKATFIANEASNTKTQFVVLLLKAIQDAFALTKAVKLLKDLVLELTRIAIATVEGVLSRSKTEVADAGSEDVVGEKAIGLVHLVEHFGGVLFGDSDIAKRIDDLMSTNTAFVLSHIRSLCLAYFARRGDISVRMDIWRNLLSALAADEALATRSLPKLLEGLEGGTLPARLWHADDEDVLDATAARLVARALGGSDKELLETVHKMLQNYTYFLSRRSFAGLLHSIVYAFSEKSRLVIRDTNTTTASSIAASLLAPLSLIWTTLSSHPEAALADDVRTFLPDVYVFGFVFSRTGPFEIAPDNACATARQIWDACLTIVDAEMRESLLVALKDVLKDLIADIDSRATPIAVLNAITESRLSDSVDVLGDLFPSRDELENMLDDLPSNPIDPLLAIVDPTIPPPLLWKDEEVPLSSFDASGLSEYTRIANALLSVTANDRHMARENFWLLRHFLFLSFTANDLLLVPKTENVIFSRSVSPGILKDIVSRAEMLTAFLLADVAEDGWHEKIVKGHLQGDAASLDGVAQFVVGLLAKAKESDSVRDSRILYAALRHTLNGATADADQWVSLARKIERHAPRTSDVIVLAVAESGLEPLRLDRLRNELAAGIYGIRASKANTEGLPLLRRLAVTAPDPDSDVVFLPQNRAINFMKACQSWIASDEDIDEDLESEMVAIFAHLVPLLQSVTGAHWDLIFDVIENNLENSSFEDQGTLVMLAKTMRLLTAVQDLTSSNKSLRALWKEREIPILTLVRDLVSSAKSSRATASVPRAICWELALSIAQDLPAKLVDHETLPMMVHLVLDPSPSVQKMAYTLLEQASHKRTEHLVVEAGVNSSADAKFELPEELLQVIARALEIQDNADIEPNTFGYLLGWMVLFDSFDSASLRVKMGYASQLRELDLIGSSFLPVVFDLLSLYSGGGKPFPLDIWSIEEYYIDLYDVEDHISAKLLAAHLFYRALLYVPSLVASWWGDCKDKQLSSTVATLTTRHFSPSLIATELAHVRDADPDAEPAPSPEAAENWKVKVSTAINEVSASYMVDDQAMEIVVRLPPDYPLHGIEVREVRRLGVEEKRWRGWLLAVQQVVTSQNGRIVDGLNIFKKNVMHHFENQTECAICYSIISVTELSLPKKRCKTCKNRFHASCLYKWFNTSHTSSCPLCRSDFI